MTISKRVQKELVQATPGIVTKAERTRMNKVKASREARAQREAIAARTKGQAWTKEEHERFLEALTVYPSGPWEAVAEYVGTKNSRQTMTHAQKYRQKHERQQRGLRASLKTTKAAKASTPRHTAQPYEVRSAATSEKPMEIVTTPLPELRATDVESPRSSEEEHEQLLPPIDMDLFSSLVASEPSTKLDNASLLEQLFMDFDPQLTLQAHMWSTNSLSEDVPIDGSLLVLDELSALPEEISQSLGMWVP